MGYLHRHISLYVYVYGYLGGYNVPEKKPPEYKLTECIITEIKTARKY